MSWLFPPSLTPPPQLSPHIPTECCNVSPDTLAPGLSPRGLPQGSEDKTWSSSARQMNTEAPGCWAGSGVHREVCGYLGSRTAAPGMYRDISVFFHRSVLFLQIEVTQKLGFTKAKIG